MIKIAALAAGLGLAAMAQADVPVFIDNVLTINEAVVVTGTGPKYYGDVQLRANANGSLSVIAGELRSLAYIEDAEVELDTSVRPAEATLHVSGNLPTPCNELEEPAFYRKDNTIHVLLAVDELGPAESCIQKIEPFDVEIPLDIAGLDAGTYKVVVNGTVEATFTLASDND